MSINGLNQGSGSMTFLTDPDPDSNPSFFEPADPDPDPYPGPDLLFTANVTSKLLRLANIFRNSFEFKS